MAKTAASPPPIPQRGTPERRIELRRSLKLPVGEAGLGQGIVHDLSLTGLLLETSDALQVGERIEFALPERGPTAAIVVWNSGRYFGCQFVDRITQGAMSAAVLRSPAIAKAEVLEAIAAEPYPKLSRPARALTLIGLAAASWGLIFLLVHASLHAIA